MAAHNDKRLTKQAIKEVSLSLTISEIQNDMGLVAIIRVSGHLLLGVSRIFSRQMKYLYDDCNEMLMVLSKPKDPSRSIRFMPGKNIILDLHFDNVYIDDEMMPDPVSIREIVSEHDGGDENMLPFTDSRLENEGFGVELDSHIEYLRDETASVLTQDQTQVQITGPRREKRRKVLEDSDIEIDSLVFRARLRNTRDIVMRGVDIDTHISQCLSSNLIIAQEILNDIEMALPTGQRESIEVGRGETMVSSYFAPSFEDNSMQNGASERVDDEFFRIENLPESFCFNSLVRDCNKYEKSQAFLHLLNYVANGVAEVIQETPYGDISCIIKAEIN
jgi:hypothetical protein